MLNPSWIKVADVRDIPENGGACAKVGSAQIAIFYFKDQEEWFACQNLCPHQQEMVLSRGMIGDASGIPKVACPLHKKTFSLQNGDCLSDEDYSIQVFPVKIESESVFVNMGSPSDA